MRLIITETTVSERVLGSHYHAIVWIDHHEARIIHFNADDSDETIVHPTHSLRHIHSKSGSPAGAHERGDASYFQGVADALVDAKAFLVTGPSTAKAEFMTWLRSHVPQLVERMSGVETLPHMTENQLVAEARRYYKGADWMTPQTP